MPKNKSEQNFDIIKSPSRKTDVNGDAKISDFWCVFIRLKFEENKHVPGWTGWLSLNSEQAFGKTIDC